jgi:hypothetical protein
VFALFEELWFTVIEVLVWKLGVAKQPWGSAPDPGIF